MRRILVLDNYDSFTYNLVHYVGKLTDEPIEVHRNDKISLDDVGGFDKILLSPGPGIPSESGILLDLIKRYAPVKSILGVCLGQQAIGEAFGGRLINLDKVYHGVATPIDVLTPDDPLYSGIPSRFDVGRYHSWVVEEATLPKCFTITSRSDDGLIMGISHKTFDVRGVQYHPESVLTQYGLKIIENWLKL